MTMFGLIDENNGVAVNPRTAAHAKIFYIQVAFTLLTFALGARALLSSHIPFFSWLPALLLLFDATLAFASLLYLDFTRENTPSYLRLVLSLVVLRLSCTVILIAELFLPHSDPAVSIPLIIVSVIHSLFSLLSAVHVHSLSYTNRENLDEGRSGMKMEKCMGSTSTLVTNVDDVELIVEELI
uniref:Transmembrane protein n=1 Tax=Caenorhabditis japonica TaxID=281687 RepID=A0A8R1DWA5_CAEJA